MKQNYLIHIVMVILFFLCAPAQAQVNSSFDSGAKFGKYTTYSFLGWQKRSNEIVSARDQETILNAFKNEFERRGVAWVNGKGSATIAIHVVIDEKTAKAEYADHLHQYGYKAVWETDLADTTETSSPKDTEIAYRQGTLMVHMYDSQTRELIWQAVVTDVMQADPSVRSQTLPRHIAELMNTYPVAGR